MISQSIVRGLLLGVSTGLAVAGVSAPIVAGSLTPVMAQSSEDMTAALDAYGHRVRHAPYGEVWVPDGVPPDWRPYEYGRWVYTDDRGWYWVSDQNEDDWGWVALAGDYVGVSGDIGLGVGAGANVLLGGSGRTFALLPVSLQGSVALNVVLGVSALTLRWH
jgi:hypothetical protein